MPIELAIVLGICGGMVVMAIIDSNSHRKEIEELKAQADKQDESWCHQVDDLVSKLEDAQETIARLQDINHDLQVKNHG